MFTLFIVESAALGAFLAGNPLGFFLWGSAGAATLFIFLKGFARLLAARSGERPEKFAPRIIGALSPLCLLFLKHLSFLWFLKDIRGYLLPTALAGSASLLYLLFSDEGNSMKAEAPVPRSAWRGLFLIAFAAYAFLASGLIFPAHPLTGDEPHYLLIAKSLIDDGDINLYNNYANKDYLRFYPGELESHAKTGRLGTDHQYSRHLPGISMLLVPFYILGERSRGLETFIFIVRLPMMALAALLGALFFLLVNDLVRNRRAALGVWFVFAFTGPLLFYSGLIYPEVPASLITLLVFRHLLFRRNDRPSVLLLSGLGLALLPWLGAKYVILTVVFYALAIFSYLKKPAANLGKFVRLSILPLVSSGLFLYFLWSCYGHLNPVSTYTGADLPSSLSMIRPTRPTNIPSFVSAGLSLFFEQKTGLLVYAPAYGLAAAGFCLLWRRRKAVAAKLLVVFGAFWLMAAATYYLGGYCPPGRPLLPVTWIPAALVSAALASPAGRLASLVKGGLIGLSVLVAGSSLSVPKLLYHLNVGPKAVNFEPESHFLAAAGNLFFDPVQWTPSLTASNTLGVWPLAAWVFFLFLMTAFVLGLRKRPAADRVSFRPAGRAMIVLASSILFLAAIFFHVRLDAPVHYKAEGYELCFQDQNHFGLEQGGFWTRGTEAASVVLRSTARLSKISLSLSSPGRGHSEVQADRFCASVRHDPRLASESALIFDSPRGFPWKGTYLYLIKVRERAAFVPYQLDSRMKDNRRLGVFVRIAVK